MAKAPDLNAAIQQIVFEMVNEMLAPHLEALEKLGALMGRQTKKRGPGRPPKFGSKLTSSPLDRGDASKFQIGQTVAYKQGRGQFAAKVIKVDTKTNTVTLERAKDKKKVARPASKILAASKGGSESQSTKTDSLE